MQNETVQRYKKENQLVHSQGIVFTGSSLMEQFPVEFFMQKDIYNRGVSGFISSEYIQVLDTLIFDLAPRMVVLNIGTNDLNDPNFELARLLENYQFILEQIHQRLPKAQVIFLDFYPVNPIKMTEVATNEPWLKEVLPFRTNEKLSEANRAINQLMVQWGYETQSVNHLLLDKQGFLNENFTMDGIHLYREVYQQLAKELRPLIEKESIK